MAARRRARRSVSDGSVELRQLRTFAAVVRHRTVTDAAAALELAPSSVSQQIRTLEAALGVALFVRGGRGMQLTAAGRRLEGWARTLLAQADAAVRDVRELRPVLRLGALATIAEVYVPRVLARFARRRPDVDVDVHADGARDGLLRGVLDGHLDAALLFDAGDGIGGLGFPAPAGALEHLDLEAVPLALVAAAGSPLARLDHVAAADLRGERLLVNVPECSFWLAGQRLLGDGPRRVRAGGVPVMRAWAEHGLGVALLPEFAVADSVAGGRLVRLPMHVPDLALRLVWREDRQERAGIRDMLYAAARP
ncbi:LysR family transcriptional regulator [Dactylosporangium matsuzakiense]|uniref:LysR family transcriptional regulator n=1 Tax=Dactylosporangium matsuzakiense TaxID=53360 RepID=A0A9W6KU63_9ACTN|nr:LysR family transcriptional regulator [Dactylosporangium matsuzakiense]UWZ49009.1 LysR family transcriptional regulator [Dactylosporangium matsuzakiense]GLL07733.1 LysR family transcriptional regulator [Dactylosporangium matsuzakiense]